MSCWGEWVGGEEGGFGPLIQLTYCSNAWASKETKHARQFQVGGGLVVMGMLVMWVGG